MGTFAIADFQDLAALAGLALTAIGFVLVILQLRQLSSTIRLSAHAAVYEHGEQFRTHLVTYPEFRSYLLEGARPAKSFADRNRLYSIAESYLNYLEHLFLSRAGLGSENRKSVDNFLRSAFANAPVLENVLASRTCAYSEHFRAHARSLMMESVTGCD